MRRKGRAAGLAVGLILMGGGISASVAQETRKYEYDALGRLISAQASSSNATHVSRYVYDAAGNRRASCSQPVNVTQVVAADMETPVVSGYAYTPTSACIQFSGMSGIAANGGAFGFPTPWDGNQVAFLQSNGNNIGSFEMKAVNLVPGHQYRIAFAAAQRPGFPTNAIQLYVNGSLVMSVTPSSASAFGAYFTGNLVAASDTITIRFSSSATSYDSASAVDAVSIQPPG